jgi:uncharacterized NAD(P)/FAD-binding protein YdhS
LNGGPARRPEVVEVAIVGAGFSGTALAAHLLRLTPRSRLRVAVCERAAAVGRGLAYGTVCAGHLLNVPASRMSLYPDSPGHFLSWLRARRDAAAGPDRFAPRTWYGDYLEECLAEAGAQAESGAFSAVRAEASDAQRCGDQWVLRLAGGGALRCEALVLATGHASPRPLPGEERGRGVVNDPWREGVPAVVAPDARAVIVGSGLTMVDLLVSLREAGLRSAVRIISRHGRLPLAQPEPRPASRPPAPGWSPPPGTPLRELVAGVRREARRLAAEGQTWHAAVDAIREVTPQLWQAFPDADRARFLRHVRPLWEVHRHRLAPDIARWLDCEVRAGGLDLIAGRVVRVSPDAESSVVAYLPRGSRDESHVRADLVLNATGPAADPIHASDSLMRRLLERGDIARDPHGIGLRLDESGQALGADGRPRPGLFILGPARRARDWEATAVPELSRHAHALAGVLARRFG